MIPHQGINAEPRKPLRWGENQIHKDRSEELDHLIREREDSMILKWYD